MTREAISINIADGSADGYFFHGGEPAPGVIIYMDGIGLRPALYDMAERLVDNGYSVLLPNMFYRFGPAEPMTLPGDFERMMKMVVTVTPTTSMRDTAAFLDYLETRPEVKGRWVGTTGYCMGGAQSLTAAAEFPDRVVAAAAFHAGALATDRPDSPHRHVGKITGDVYVAVAGTDPFLGPTETDDIRAALAKAGPRHVLEIYPGTQHGWTMPDLPIYDQQAAERHWDNLLALFARKLG
ncbi:dienelactone hydrolase family protein [Emcibacter sp. SYSU 3D8]|uniref:dienelactone hydrolase family protein n=1 Tax=Emcibacter sp. SYSU 3D8 TaxID=3133969 RepID=UPI0031FEC398